MKVILMEMSRDEREERSVVCPNCFTGFMFNPDTDDNFSIGDTCIVCNKGEFVKWGSISKSSNAFNSAAPVTTTPRKKEKIPTAIVQTPKKESPVTNKVFISEETQAAINDLFERFK